MLENVEPWIRTEVMAEFFTKYHVEGINQLGVTIHKFTAADGGDPHDHPWAFRSLILFGGYVERIYNPLNGNYIEVERKRGDCFFNDHDHVHVITKLLGPECWTLILPEVSYRKWGFYQFREDGTYYRAHDEQSFRRYEHD